MRKVLGVAAIDELKVHLLGRQTPIRSLNQE
jgi:hypothetical protein